MSQRKGLPLSFGSFMSQAQPGQQMQWREFLSLYVKMEKKKDSSLTRKYDERIISLEKQLGLPCGFSDLALRAHVPLSQLQFIPEKREHNVDTLAYYMAQNFMVFALPASLSREEVFRTKRGEVITARRAGRVHYQVILDDLSQIARRWVLHIRVLDKNTGKYYVLRDSRTLVQDKWYIQEWFEVDQPTWSTTAAAGSNRHTNLNLIPELLIRTGTEPQYIPVDLEERNDAPEGTLVYDLYLPANHEIFAYTQGQGGKPMDAEILQMS